jgi:hypothetical protein
MSIKKPFSFFDISRANPTATLLEKLFRDSITYKKDIDDLFEATVLTQPTLSSENRQAVLNNILSSDSNNRTTYCFIVRIDGPDSPHLFIPDPSEFYLTPDEECQKRYHNLLQLHTLVVANDTAKEALPSIGDKVQIRLSKGNYLYDTNISNDYRGVTVKSATGGKELRDRRTRLQQNAKNAFNKGVSGTLPTTAPPTTLGVAGAGGTDANKIALHKGYKTYEKSYGSRTTPTIQAIYDYLYDSLASQGLTNIDNLVLAIMTNIEHESGFDPYRVSDSKTESSIGLFQMNVGGEARRGTSAGRPSKNKVHTELKILEADGKVIPYFAGSLYLIEEQSLVPLTPEEYVKNGANSTSLRMTYEKMIDWRSQIDWTAEVVKGMIDPLQARGKLKFNDINAYSIQDWTTWFQFYYEQPDNENTRSWSSRSLALRESP